MKTSKPRTEKIDLCVNKIADDFFNIVMWAGDSSRYSTTASSEDRAISKCIAGAGYVNLGTDESPRFERTSKLGKQVAAVFAIARFVRGVAA